MQVKAHLNLPSINELKKKYNLNDGGKVQKYIDSFVLYRSEPYLPRNIGELYNSSISATKIGSGKVIWNTDYANYLYEGWLMVDELTFSSWARPYTQKIMDPKNRHLHYKGEPKRGDHWIEKMTDKEMDKLLEGIVKIVESGKNNK